jgi:hypothetical protein
VAKAIGSRFKDLALLDARLPRALARIVMVSSIHPRRVYNDRENEAKQQEHRKRVEAAISAELRWLDSAESEPVWPELPAWLSRPRRGIRIGGRIVEDDLDQEVPEQYVDEHALGALVGYLIPLTLGDLPPWVVALAAHLMRWTDEANGPNGEEHAERDNRPYTWNSHFFDFAGILSVALPHDDVVSIFLQPITRFKDEAFHDATAEFLRGFDRATLAIDTKRPENPAAVRVLVANRVRQSWNFRRLGREKGFTSESHAGDALNAMFYQPYRLANRGRPSIPDNWNGLDATMPTLTALIIEAPSSGYFAILFLNLVESSPRAALLPFVVQATTAWCSAYGVDTNFWAEKDIGSRVCTWFDRTFTADPTAADTLSGVVDELLRSLDILIQSGVAQASEIEDRIAIMAPMAPPARPHNVGAAWMRF